MLPQVRRVSGKMKNLNSSVFPPKNTNLTPSYYLTYVYANKYLHTVLKFAVLMF